MGNGTENTYAYDRQSKRLLECIKSQDDFIELKMKSSLIHSRFYFDFLASLASDTLCNISNFALTYK